MTGRDLEEFRKNVLEPYWRECAEKWTMLSDERWRKYFSDILPEELKHAKGEGRLKHEQREALILLVGFSLEPLFQSICAWKPQKKVFFILNSSYGKNTGDEVGSALGDIVEMLKDMLKPEPDLALPADLQTDFGVLRPTASPEAVFKMLRKKALKMIKDYGHDQVVLDITGGKKSMVAGAYLFGAYADIDISYVDFADDAFSQEFNRPYGDACDIDLIKNPYNLFALRDWQRVEELYEHYAFRSAGQLAKELEKNTARYFSDNDLEAVKRLIAMLEIHEAWESGDYTGALEDFGKIKPGLAAKEKQNLPTAIKELGDNGFWPHIERDDTARAAYDKLLGTDGRSGDMARLELGDNAGNPPLYLSIPRLLQYANDELKKIDRLIDYNEDYRSALLRAASLNEVLLRARLILLWSQNLISIQPNCHNERDARELLGGLQLWQVRKLLSTDESIPSKGHRIQKNRTATNWDTNLWVADGLKEEQLPHLRNKAIHFCLSVTSRLAKAGREIAGLNLNDFTTWLLQQSELKKQATIQNYMTEQIPWDDLCEICGIKFIPPKRNQPEETV